MASWFAKNPNSEYFNAIDQILHYLAGSYKRNIIFKREKELKLVKLKIYLEIFLYTQQRFY